MQPQSCGSCGHVGVPYLCNSIYWLWWMAPVAVTTSKVLGLGTPYMNPNSGGNATTTKAAQTA